MKQYFKICIDFFTLIKVNPSKFRFIETHSYFEFCAILKGVKTLPGFVNNIFISIHLIVFLDHVLPLVELAQKFKIAV